MKILISASSQSLSAVVHPRFGRADYLILFDSEKQTHQIFANPALHQSGGAGVAAAQFVVDQGAEVVISSHFGPNAAEVLSAAGIKMALFSESTKTCQETITDFQNGDLKEFIND